MEKKIQEKRVDIISIKMVKESSLLYGNRRINSPRNAENLLMPLFEGMDREAMLAVYMNARNEPTTIHTVSIGSLNSSIVYLQEK